MYSLNREYKDIQYIPCWQLNCWCNQCLITHTVALFFIKTDVHQNCSSLFSLFDILTQLNSTNVFINFVNFVPSCELMSKIIMKLNISFKKECIKCQMIKNDDSMHLQWVQRKTITFFISVKIIQLSNMTTHLQQPFVSSKSLSIHKLIHFFQL